MAPTRVRAQHTFSSSNVACLLPFLLFPYIYLRTTDPTISLPRLSLPIWPRTLRSVVTTSLWVPSLVSSTVAVPLRRRLVSWPSVPCRPSLAGARSGSTSLVAPPREPLSWVPRFIPNSSLLLDRPPLMCRKDGPKGAFVANRYCALIALTY